MRKFTSIFLAAVLVSSLTACKGGETSIVKDWDNTEHTHECTKVIAKDPTCLKEGNTEYWSCFGCDNIYQDQAMTKQLSLQDVMIPKLSHAITAVDAEASTCAQNGHEAYWYCSNCFTYFSDAEGKKYIADKGDVVLDTTAHALVHQQATSPAGFTNGNIEHWSCVDCDARYLDEKGFQKTTKEATVVLSSYNIVDFVVEVPVGENPIVLQLTDTQIIDAGQARPGRGGVDHNFWATDKMDERCYDYITEVVNATNPHLILLTGDIIYGEFDDNGTALTKFINFMDSLQIPWAPIFGNHENESAMGADWQCEQLENARYCLFEQKTLTGNGNYSVAIAQDGEIKRAFYMLDSNGCGAASSQSLANGHTQTAIGFGQDQIDWYTQEITALKAVAPDTKISFAYHIQGAIFEQAFAQYGFNQAVKEQNINIDRLTDKASTDFGHIGRQLKNPWDADYSVFNGMKALGADSIFVGHEHCNSASVVYEGVRFQFGQKSSEYDRFNYLYADGSISSDNGANATSLMGGTVIPLSNVDGSIVNPYIYYCGYPNGQINWSQFH